MIHVYYVSVCVRSGGSTLTRVRDDRRQPTLRNVQLTAWCGLRYITGLTFIRELLPDPAREGPECPVSTETGDRATRGAATLPLQATFPPTDFHRQLSREPALERLAHTAHLSPHSSVVT